MSKTKPFSFHTPHLVVEPIRLARPIKCGGIPLLENVEQLELREDARRAGARSSSPSGIHLRC